MLDNSSSNSLIDVTLSINVIESLPLRWYFSINELKPVSKLRNNTYLVLLSKFTKFTMVLVAPLFGCPLIIFKPIQKSIFIPPNH